MIGHQIGTNRYLAPEQESVKPNTQWTFQTDLYPVGIIAIEMYVPSTRKLKEKEIRDIEFVAKEWKMRDNSELSERVFKKIIVNLVQEVRALRFNSIEEVEKELKKIKEVI